MHISADLEHFAAVVIGAGQAGVPLARELAGAGWRTALIERQYVGGSCVNFGCTPTKTMYASARIAYLATQGAEFGVQVPGRVQVDMEAVRRRKRQMVESFRQGGQRRLESTPNLELIFGHARFRSPHILTVTLNDESMRIIEAPYIFIDTGTRPAIPDISGLAGVPYLDSTSIMELDRVPEHLLILGGGYIGVEFGQMFRRFGAEVTILQRRPQLLPREDADIAQAVADILREDGLEIVLEASAQAVQEERGHIVARVSTPQGEREFIGSHLLIAAGRLPNSDDLGLEEAGIETDVRGYIRSSDKLETNVEGVFALGDVKDGPAFTHISYDDYRVIRANLLEGREATIAGRQVPYTIFMDPQLGRIGMTERDAQEKGLRYRVARMPMAWVARALEAGETRGMMKILVAADTGQILGAAVLGMEGGEIMSTVQMAMLGGLPYSVLQNAIFAHPTLAEALNNLFDHLEEP